MTNRYEMKSVTYPRPSDSGKIHKCEWIRGNWSNEIDTQAVNAILGTLGRRRPEMKIFRIWDWHSDNCKSSRALKKYRNLQIGPRPRVRVVVDFQFLEPSSWLAGPLKFLILGVCEISWCTKKSPRLQTSERHRWKLVWERPWLVAAVVCALNWS